MLKFDYFMDSLTLYSITAVLLYWLHTSIKGNCLRIHLDNNSFLITCFTLLGNNIIFCSSLTLNAFSTASGCIPRFD